MSASGFSKRSSVTPQHFYNAAVDENKVTVFTEDNNIYGFLIENNGAFAVYLQCFDNLAAAVTVGTTAPSFTFRIPAYGTLGKDSQQLALSFCKRGLVIAITSGRDDAVAPAAPATVHVWHSKKG